MNRVVNELSPPITHPLAILLPLHVAIANGTRLGPYEIVAPIGAGGMGEVFKARDTRLERSVAIKVLPAELARDAQFKLRFEREAKAISALTHPNICTLYDVGHDKGTDYLVMELLEGESLADKLAKGPLPLDQVLRYGAQIAEALDRAHKAGVIHRDLKPGNIMITRAGAKLLDFGLAKSQPSALSPQSSMETQHKALTAEGTIIGTFQYMAPEQLEGEEADACTDIFALGAVLYEMATGKRAFEGKTRTSLIAAIVAAQPTPISQLQPLTPPVLEHVVQRCLEKVPDDRWQSAHDIAEELKWIGAIGSQAGVAAPVARGRKRRDLLQWIVPLLTAVAAVAVTWAVMTFRREPPSVVTSSIVAPESVTPLFMVGAPALSPDGRFIVLIAGQTNRPRQLWLRPLSGGAAQPLAGTDGASYPFWSPDSGNIAFFADGELRRLSLSGAATQKIADAPAGRGGSWSKDGVILFAPDITGPLMRVTVSGANATPATKVDEKREESGHRWPFFLPDGEHFLMFVDREGGDSGEDRIAVGSLDGTVRKDLFHTQSNAAYASGYLLFQRDKALVAQPFDTKNLSLTGDAAPVAATVDVNPNRADAIFSVSAGGEVVYLAGGVTSASQLVWFDRSGKQLEVFPKAADYNRPALSRDGRRIAVGVVDPVTRRGDVWVLDAIRKTSTRLTFDREDEGWPIWSANDQVVTYTIAAMSANASGAVFARRSSGAAAPTRIFALPGATASDVSPDGTHIAFQTVNSGPRSGFDLWLFSTKDGQRRVFLQTPFNESNARFSPDGSWIAYTSAESGRAEIYAQPVSGTGGKWQISTDGGIAARWSRDGKELFYVAPDDTLFAVEVNATGDQLSPSVPKPLFKPPIRRVAGTQYDVASDGRFIINVAAEQRETLPLTLVQNWPELLREKR